MRTVKLKSVLEAVCRKEGLDVAQIDSVQTDLGSFINFRLRQGWNWEWWPETMVTEQRNYGRGSYFNGVTYALGEIVWDAAGEKYYESLQDGNVGNLLSEIAWWAEASEFDRFVEWDQVEKDAIGRVRGTYMRNPRLKAKPGEMNFEQSANGVQISALAGNSVWLDYQKKPPTFTSVSYSATTDYSVGDVAYDSTSGECYRALLANGPSSFVKAVTNTFYWIKVDFPYFLERFVVSAAYSDLLASDGQTGKSIAEEERAMDILMDAADTVAPQRWAETVAYSRT